MENFEGATISGDFEQADPLCEVCEQEPADVIVALCSPLATRVRACAKCALAGVEQGAATW